MDNLWAEALATGNETQQAEFLNVFVHTLVRSCRSSLYGSLSMQAHYIAGRITNETAMFLLDVAETHKYLQNEYSDAVMETRAERVRELDKLIAAKEALLGDA